MKSVEITMPKDHWAILLKALNREGLTDDEEFVLIGIAELLEDAST